MTSKQHRLRRSTQWHAHRGIKIGRKVAWRVLGFASPKAYREWRDQRIRYEASDGFVLQWRKGEVTSQAWLDAQPSVFRALERMAR